MDDLQSKIAEAIRNPQNMGALPQADAVGTVGSPECGEMLRLWIKFKEQHGKKVIDRATFQSFGCETAIAVASLATEVIRGKTPQEALALSGAELAADLGPLPPMKIHCSQLVEAALRSALATDAQTGASSVPPQTGQPAATGNLVESLAQAQNPSAPKRIVLLDDPKEDQK